MKSKEQLYGEALAIKEANLTARSFASRTAAEKARDDNPELVDLESAISKLGAQIPSAVLSGNTSALGEIRAQMSALTAQRDQILASAALKPMTYDCEECLDTGYVSGKICSCVHELVKQLRMAELAENFPVKSCRFDNFDLNYYPVEEDENRVSPRKRMTQILKLCREYTLNFDPKTSENLLFMGGAGLGKTHLTLAMVAEITLGGHDVFYSTANGLFSALENEHFNLHSTDTFDAVLACDLLAIDDLGSEFASPYTKSALYNIVNSRLLSGKPTIISTNLSMAEIERIYSSRIASRLIGEYTAKKFCGRDIRQLRAMERLKK